MKVTQENPFGPITILLEHPTEAEIMRRMIDRSPLLEKLPEWKREYGKVWDGKAKVN